MNWDKFFSVTIRLVFLFAFAAFLWASIHHIATFYANFEPSGVDMTGSYALAISVDGTALILTIGVMFFSKTMPRHAKIIVWFFIFALMGFSWIVNWEYAARFQSANLTSNPTLIWLNPILASSFAFLNVAYAVVSEFFNFRIKTVKDLQAELDGLDERLNLENQIKEKKNAGKKGFIERAKDTAIEIKNAANEVLEKNAVEPAKTEAKEQNTDSIENSINQPVEQVSPTSIEEKTSQQDTSNEEEQKPQSEQTTSRRTMTIDEVVNATGLTERRVKNLIAKKVLKVSSRNANLVLISSFDEWVKITPNGKETGEIPVVQLANNNHSNGGNNGTAKTTV